MSTALTITNLHTKEDPFSELGMRISSDFTLDQPHYRQTDRKVHQTP